MILTHKIKHNQNLNLELVKAKQIAIIAKETKTRSSKDVKHIGLSSSISNQILRKYSSNQNLKQIKSVKLTIPSQGIQLKEKKIKISCLKLMLDFPKETNKIYQIELDNTYAYISYHVEENTSIKCQSWIGVDLNTTRHCLVAANPKTKKVWKLGKSSNHIHQKYKNLRRNLQKRNRYKALAKIKNKESRIVRDLNHKISKKIVLEARKTNSGIVLEDLKKIRKTAKTSKKFRYALNSWSFYQLKTFIRYKAKLLGIPIAEIDPKYTSKQCSKCGLLGERKGKVFQCSCGHVENADVNASFVISLRHIGILQSPVDRDIGEGHLGEPQEGNGLKESKPQNSLDLVVGVCQKIESYLLEYIRKLRYYYLFSTLILIKPKFP